jgi:hypothetical protein
MDNEVTLLLLVVITETSPFIPLAVSIDFTKTEETRE